MSIVHHYNERAACPTPWSPTRWLHVAALGEPETAPDSFFVEFSHTGHDGLRVGLSRGDVEVLVGLLHGALEAGPRNDGKCLRNEAGHQPW